MELGELQFLVADADDFQRRWLSAMLTNLGARYITEATDGLAALALLQRGEPPIDVSLLDLQLPGMDGMALIRNLAEGKQASSVILVSSLDSALMFSVAAMARAYGIELLGTIEKPAAPETLAALLKLHRSPQQLAVRNAPPPVVADSDLQMALQERQFEPLFQPKVALAGGQVKGVEAFARWPHPQLGWISPAVFIPLLEHSGQMEALTWIVLDKSAAASRLWRAAGHILPVSVNLSPSTLAQPGFAERIALWLAQQALDANSLIFEVTESATVSNLPAFLENLARLRMLGFTLSVDDFGTGQASMQDLLRIPFSEVKIDRSFVAGASQNAALEMVLSASLELCRKLNRQSVAVGVETQQDWDFLSKLGCDYAQGFHIAKPMVATSIPGWMEEWAQFF